MAWIQMSHYADTLGMHVRCNVILPVRDYWREDPGRYPVLWLLHGAFGNCDDWMRYTSVERYAAEKGLMVVMPSAQNSSYMDMRHGGQYYTYITKELREKILRMFPASPLREDNCLCGLSMGGWGSVMIGMANPEHYAAVGCLSAGIDFVEHILPDSLILDGQCPLYQDVRRGARLIAAGERPKVRVYMAMGTEDALLQYARRARGFFEGFPAGSFDFTYVEAPGTHSWPFWDAQLKAFLEWLSPAKRTGIQ